MSEETLTTYLEDLRKKLRAGQDPFAFYSKDMCTAALELCDIILERLSKED